jgi:hypothetical protein
MTFVEVDPPETSIKLSSKEINMFGSGRWEVGEELIDHRVDLFHGNLSSG